MLMHADDPPALKPSTRRSRKLRKDRAEGGQAELRGVYLPLTLHAEAKRHLKDWLQQRADTGGTTREK